MWRIRKIFPFPSSRTPSRSAAKTPSVVVGSHKGDRVVSTQGRIDDHRRNPRPLSLRDGPHQGFVVQGGQDDSIDSAVDEILNQRQLLVPVVLFLGTLPNDLDAELPRGFDRTGVYGLPKLVGRSFGDHGDSKFFPPFLRRGMAGNQKENQQGEDSYLSEAFHSFHYHTVGNRVNGFDR